MQLFLVAVVAFLLSLIGKWIADAFLTAPLLYSGVGLELSHNPGIAFGVRLGSFIPWVPQTLVVIIALVVIVWLARQPAHRSSLEQTGFGLIIGGALGNLADRMFDGLVTDFIRIGMFPVFNVADACISVGAALLLLAWLRMR